MRWERLVADEVTAAIIAHVPVFAPHFHERK
jgi:hypothetical protein